MNDPWAWGLAFLLGVIVGHHFSTVWSMVARLFHRGWFWENSRIRAHDVAESRSMTGLLRFIDSRHRRAGADRGLKPGTRSSIQNNSGLPYASGEGRLALMETGAKT
jgi:hypothetical protein